MRTPQALERFGPVLVLGKVVQHGHPIHLAVGLGQVDPTDVNRGSTVLAACEHTECENTQRGVEQLAGGTGRAHERKIRFEQIARTMTKMNNDRGNRATWKKVLLLASMGMAFQSHAQTQGFRMGLALDPNVSWMNSRDFEHTIDGGRAHFGYQFMADILFAETYAIGTGVNVFRTGSTVEYWEPTTDSTLSRVSRSFNNQYVELPVTFKLRTKEIGYTTYYGKFGGGLGLNTRREAERRYGFERSGDTWAPVEDAVVPSPDLISGISPACSRFDDCSLGLSVALRGPALMLGSPTTTVCSPPTKTKPWSRKTFPACRDLVRHFHHRDARARQLPRDDRGGGVLRLLDNVQVWCLRCNLHVTNQFHGPFLICPRRGCPTHRGLAPRLLAESGMDGWVVGVSGGIDSAVTSTLCAMTGAPTTCVEMPIHQVQIKSIGPPNTLKRCVRGSPVCVAPRFP